MSPHDPGSKQPGSIPLLPFAFRKPTPNPSEEGISGKFPLLGGVPVGRGGFGLLNWDALSSRLLPGEEESPWP